METLLFTLRRPWIESQLESVQSITLRITRSLGMPYSYWRSSTLALSIYLAIVAGVAIYDILLTVAYAESLEYMEQNPVGRWLMGFESYKPGHFGHFGKTPDLTLFLAMKFVGTITVLATMYYLFTRRGRIGHPVALGVASFQLFLAFYLTFALPDK